MVAQSSLIKAVTVFGPVTVTGKVTSEVARDWVDYSMAIGSLGALFIGIAAVLIASQFAKKADLEKRYLDVLISTSEEKYKALIRLVNQMHAVVQVLEFGIETKKGYLNLAWNNDLSYCDRVLQVWENFNVSNRENISYQSSDFQPYVEVFRWSFDEAAINVDGTQRQVAMEKWVEMIKFQKSIVDKANVLLGLETNRSAMGCLWENDSKKFYRLLKENSKQLKKLKEEIKPFLEKARQTYKNWRKPEATSTN